MNPQGLNVNIPLGSLLASTEPPKRIVSKGLAPRVDAGKIIPPTGTHGENYSATPDPNVVIGKYGAVITRAQFENQLRDPANNLKFTSFDDYANWVGGWALSPGAKQKWINGQPTPPPISDKAAGLSNDYYSPVQQNKGPAIPTVSKGGY